MRGDIEGIAFDLDGTLYPNYRLNVRLLPFIIKEGRFLSAFGKVRKIIRKEQAEGGLPQTDFYSYQAQKLAEILPFDSGYLKDKIDSMIYRGWEPLFKNIRLFRGVKETLAAMKKAGFKLGLLSDFPPETKINNLDIGGIWDAVLCSERCGAIKPHTLSFKLLAEGMSLPCEKILYAGNSLPYDVAGAAAAGMKTAWIRNPLFPGGGKKDAKPDFSFHNYRQLYNFMVK